MKLNALSCRPSEEIIKHQANFLSETGKKWKGLKNTVKLNRNECEQLLKVL